MLPVYMFATYDKHFPSVVKLDVFSGTSRSKTLLEKWGASGTDRSDLRAGARRALVGDNSKRSSQFQSGRKLTTACEQRGGLRPDIVKCFTLKGKDPLGAI